MGLNLESENIRYINQPTGLERGGAGWVGGRGEGGRKGSVSMYSRST